MEKLYVLLFYKFVEIDRPDIFAKKHLKFCKEIGLFGRVLVGNEGINGSIFGTREQVEKYKEGLTSDRRFLGIVFKEDDALMNPFTRMKVLVRDEIVTFGKKVSLAREEDYISSEGLNELYNSGEEFIILDTRNDYEYKVGKFKNAIHLNIKNFRDFPEALQKIENLKEKKIVTYCTGGIRCEKVLPYMKEKGFKDVKQLKDGILTFGKKFPNTFWEGKCFVFDKRLISTINSKENNPISNCENCGVACDLYKNCRNNDCDKLFISCVNCQDKLIGCCSKDCLNELKKDFMKKSFSNQGRKVNAEA